MHFDYHIPTKIIFGRGRLKELATEELPGSKALIVITNGQSMKRLGYLNQVTQYLKENGVDSVLFDKVLPNPTLAHVSEAAELARRENCDMVVGLGGGSAIDSAKAIVLAATNPGNYWEYVKGREVENAALPIVAIPTTAGTGTESDPWTVITNLETNEKIGFGIKQLFPTLSIVDPELMVSVPANLTAYQGMDAFFHSAEGYLAKVAQPLSDLFALNSIRRIAKFLPEAVKDGNNLQAREEMAWASTQAGMVESTSCCISEHSMEHALSAFYPGLPHGAGLAALSVPYFTHLLKKDEKKVAPRYMDMARAMGEENVNSPSAFITALKKLIKNVGLEGLKLSDWGLRKDDAEKLAENSFAAMGALYLLDPVELTREDACAIISEAIQ